VQIFVVAGLALLLARRRGHDVWAGACFGAAFLFRIELGLYAAAAGLAVLIWRDRWAAWHGAMRFLAGAAGCLMASRLILGWPGVAWFAHTLGDLTKFHRDAMGLPIVWPLRGAAVSPDPWHAVHLGVLISWLLFVALLLPLAARLATTASVARSREALALLFAASFAFLAVRSVLERADIPHALAWRALPLLVTFLLGVATLRGSIGWSRRASCLVLFAVPIVTDLGAFQPLPHRATQWRQLAADVAARPRQLLEHLRPNPPVGLCADRLLTPREARLDRNRELIAGSCEVEALLRAHDISSFLVMHSAPWYYARFGMEQPSRYFAPARAYTPDRQAEFVADVRARSPGALLVAAGYYALTQYDLPDSLRIPVVDAYLGARRAGAPALPTALGTLVLWNEPAVCPAVPARGPTLPLDLSTLSGDAWRELPAALQRARALGRADRAAACPHCDCADST
jgi:hypothetical protein